jgi:2-polyprenyl-6-methoxyphenol hydroxylase-like FAD-dependent oxidoreductase
MFTTMEAGTMTTRAHGALGRVLIIGAGLGGLTLAHGLARAGIDFRVYEQERGVHARFQGHRIGLRTEGREALLACLPERLHGLSDAVCGDLTGPGLVLDSQLNELHRGPGFEPDAIVVDRHVLRHLLLTGLTDQVEFGRRLSGVAEQPDGTVRATFADGSEAAGDVLVGADGGSSAVRARLLPHIRLVESDLCGALGRTMLTDRFAALVPGASTMVKGPGATLVLGPMRFRRPPVEAAAELAPDVRLPATSSYLRWVMLVPPDHPIGRPGAAARDAREVVLDLIAGWHPDLVDLIAAGDPDNNVAGRSMVTDRPLEPWAARRMTLLGDAAHLTLASGGNGANNALRDAELLCRHLVQADRGGLDVVAALEAYQDEMLARGNAAVEHSKEALGRFIPDS